MGKENLGTIVGQIDTFWDFYPNDVVINDNIDINDINNKQQINYF